MPNIDIDVVSQLSLKQFRTIQNLLENAFPNQRAYFLDNPEYSPNTLYLIAETEKEGIIVGFCSLHFYQRVSGVCTAVIEDVVVHQLYRGNGLGKKIIKIALENASSSANKIVLQTEIQNKNFYSRCGLKPSDPLITMTKYIKLEA
jgi:predicted GNAT family N-acyltransferase